MEQVQEIRQEPVEGLRFKVCQRCKRSLSNPKAMAIGFGKVCLAKSGGRRQVQPELPKASDAMILKPTSLRLGLIAYEKDGSRVTNVPWRAICHSPDGFAWGYGGSGPTDFALNLAEAVLREIGYRGKREKVKPGPQGDGKVFRLAFTLGDLYKRQFIAKMDQDKENQVSWEALRSWAHEAAAREWVNK
jgi:hypothetical protein